MKETESLIPDEVGVGISGCEKGFISLSIYMQTRKGGSYQMVLLAS
jgi:hypothetical protein